MDAVAAEGAAHEAAQTKRDAVASRVSALWLVLGELVIVVKIHRCL